MFTSGTRNSLVLILSFTVCFAALCIHHVFAWSVSQANVALRNVFALQNAVASKWVIA